MTFWTGIGVLVICLIVVAGLIYALAELIPAALDEGDE